MADELCFMPAARLAELFRTCQASPVDLVTAMLERIERLNPKLNAYLTVMADQALADARQAESDIHKGEYLGPLHGIPVALKDLYLTNGVRTTGGSKILADWVPHEDATTVSKLKAAGAIIIGKAHMHEFAMGPTNVNPHYGPACNPWNPECVPGGSSGGSGAAVAASMATVAMGSDTGGSIRIPGSLCGIAGHKPTYGLVSRYGVLPLSWSLDHAGPMTKTVEDAALMLNALAGYDLKDPASANRPVPDFRDALTGRVRGLRAGLPRRHFFDGLDPEVAAAVDDAIELLSGLGMSFTEVDFRDVEHVAATTMSISWSEATSYHEPYLDRLDDYGPDVRSRLELGKTMTATDYLRAQRVRRLICEEYASLMEKVDVLVTPTIRIPAPRIDECGEVLGVAGGADVKMVLSALTRPFNVTGAPALTVPCGFTTGGLPIGLQIAGRAFDDEVVLRVGHAYQTATAWHKRLPPV
ncbi:MAG: aspartyl/glutamyl-tRNA amidotransferase subunit A [Bacteroidetes bacterium]|nr:aspartyl/glutamyl-tRNA amidotransferase subunit A [Bacteroidota bacterium]MCL5025211.1 aspartyl/glutamyl-tRNA amidotransferase subunit A [Chloroflexota bacterium]